MLLVSCNAPTTTISHGSSTEKPRIPQRAVMMFHALSYAIEMGSGSVIFCGDGGAGGSSGSGAGFSCTGTVPLSSSSTVLCTMSPVKRFRNTDSSSAADMWGAAEFT